MCGIAGVMGTPNDRWIVDLMLSRLAHRGPDERGECRTADSILAHARLSIVDVDGGKQPIVNEDGSVCIVCNGEIYNHRKLREQLRGPHVFTTGSDTEVILHLYEEVGERCVRMLDGMFAFALLDINRGLLLARDPLGVKPLYIATMGDTIYFASEMKALMGVVPSFEEFPAGHYRSDTGLQRFFDLTESITAVPTAEKAMNGILYYVKQAVRKRMMSDVPVGVFLSGGLDSSIIALLASKQKPGLKTFAIGMSGSKDLMHARLCAQTLGTDHHEIVYTVDDMLAVLPQVIYHLESYDAALVRSSIPNFLLAREAANYVKVILTGEGADEVFSGYHYLKTIGRADLRHELVEITEALHNTNLQRCDRMSMAQGLEARVPFLDVDLVRFALGIPADMKLAADGTEKWILRQAYQNDLPPEIVFRRKSKFSEGCGSHDALMAVAEDRISDPEYERNAVLPNGRRLRSKEELMYYRIFHSFYPTESAHAALGFSRSL